ncbi:hypothetical protein K505DRAFT_331383 [Melanomma pulvis-pyrius CBS 109.77]|uniref:Uncharacterized protein n=1 Tax=Melanomma pulvis-pyrius CBS 109.77 TaxID=1314802 RepID=A0A6A6XWJ8_9PLEO|nr:hypothetical protein K505DRAFT_331383 [Melanomma pulvis-pyrius CBS 109.77]
MSTVFQITITDAVSLQRLASWPEQGPGVVEIRCAMWSPRSHLKTGSSVRVHRWAGVRHGWSVPNRCSTKWHTPTSIRQATTVMGRCGSASVTRNAALRHLTSGLHHRDVVQCEWPRIISLPYASLNMEVACIPVHSSSYILPADLSPPPKINAV